MHYGIFHISVQCNAKCSPSLMHASLSTLVGVHSTIVSRITAPPVFAEIPAQVLALNPVQDSLPALLLMTNTSKHSYFDWWCFLPYYQANLGDVSVLAIACEPCHIRHRCDALSTRTVGPSCDARGMRFVSHRTPLMPILIWPVPIFQVSFWFLVCGALSDLITDKVSIPSVYLPVTAVHIFFFAQPQFNSIQCHCSD